MVIVFVTSSFNEIMFFLNFCTESCIYIYSNRGCTRRKILFYIYLMDSYTINSKHYGSRTDLELIFLLIDHRSNQVSIKRSIFSFRKNTKRNIS